MDKKEVEKEVTIESILWNCCNALRGVGSTEKNRDGVCEKKSVNRLSMIRF